MHPDVHAETRPDEPAYIMSATKEVVTWAQLRDRSRQGAQLLRRAESEGGYGLEVGDGFAVLLDNHPRFIELLWVSQRSGLYLTPMSWHLTASEAEYIVRDSGAKVLFVCAAFESLAGELAQRLGDSVKLVSVDTAFGDFVAYEPLRDAMPAQPRDDETFGDDMLYTSGTTGRPKGIRRPLTGNAITDFPPHYARWARAIGYSDQSIHYAAGPLYHASPLHNTMIGMTYGGTVIVSQRFDPEDALQVLQDYQVTHSNWVPTHFVRLLRLPEKVRRRYDLSALQLALHGAAPCPVWVKEQMIEWWGNAIVEYYGGSEGLGGLVITAEAWLNHRGSVGKPSNAHILDEETKEELPAGEIGLIYFEPIIKMSYHNDPQKTAGIMSPQGWATLGDMGYLDADGYLYLADRRADLIITGGVNVYPREVEDRLLAHPKVVDAAVFGVPSDDWGETVHAVVQLTEPPASPAAMREELDAFCKQELSKVKCPRSYAFAERLPRQENGKLYKHVLRDAYFKTLSGS